jgi:hypothetical protein
MTLASSVATLSENALRNTANLRAALNSAIVFNPQWADLARKIHDDLEEMHSRACDVLDQEDGAPLTQEEVTRS